MLDSYARPYIDPILEKISAPVARTGLTPAVFFIFAFAVSLSGCFTVAMGNYSAGLILILLGRVIDAIGARVPGAGTDFDHYLRIVLEWVFYAGFVFFFALGWTTNYMAASFMLLAYAALAVTALAYKVIAAKRGQIDDEAAFAIFHPARLVERSEILIFMILSCLIPSFFSGFSMLFGLMALVTAGGWVFKARQNF